MNKDLQTPSGLPSLCAVYFFGRVGSTLLIRTLNSHPAILGLGELFHPNGPSLHLTGHDFTVVGRELSRNALLRELRVSNPREFLNVLSCSVKDQLPAKRLVALKISFAQEDAAKTGLLQDPACKKILLRRRNLLATFASFETARSSGVWHLSTRRDEACDGVQYQGSTSQNLSPQIIFNAEKFTAFCERVEEQYARVHSRLESARSLYIEIFYEDLLKAATLRKIADFLRVENLFTTEQTGLVKLGKSIPIDSFSNPEDVAAHLRKIGKPEWGGRP